MKILNRLFLWLSKKEVPLYNNYGEKGKYVFSSTRFVAVRRVLPAIEYDFK